MKKTLAVNENKKREPNLYSPTDVSKGLETTNSFPRETSLWIKLLPIIFFISYLNLTVFLFVFGPWPYPVEDGTYLYIFLCFCHMALLFGYLSAVFKKPRGYHGRLSIQFIVTISLIVNLLLLFPTLRYRTGSFIPDIIGGIKNPGEAYLKALNVEGTPLIEYVRISLGPFIFMLMPITVFYWKRIKPTVRALAVFSVLGVVALYIAMGTNKAIADTVLIVPLLLFASRFSQGLNLRRRHKFYLATGCIVAFMFFLIFFTSTQSTRSGSTSSAGYFPTIDMHADYDNFMTRDLPPSAQIGVLGLSAYLTQGYYALYLSLEEPFVPMFGVGNSMFLYRQAARITDMPHIEDLPYPIRIEKYGWDGYGLWSSIYPWIASDVSFPGTILVVFLIGRFFALSWVDTLRGENPFAVAMFALFLIMLFYFPANNQLFQSGESTISFFFIFIAWIITRNKIVWKSNH